MKQPNCWNPLPGKPVHKAVKCKTRAAMVCLILWPSASFTLPNPKNWVLLKHCQTSQEGRILQMTVTVLKTALQCKGNEAGMQHPSHGALQCTHHPWHWAHTNRKHQSYTHLLAPITFPDFMNRGCTHVSAQSEKQQQKERGVCKGIHVLLLFPFAIVPLEQFYSSLFQEGRLTFNLESGNFLLPPPFTAYVFSYIIMEEERFNDNSTTHTLETWVPLATFNKSLLAAPSLMKMHLRSLRAN